MAPGLPDATDGFDAGKLFNQVRRDCLLHDKSPRSVSQDAGLSASGSETDEEMLKLMNVKSKVNWRWRKCFGEKS